MDRFETRGERLSSSDPDGTWALTYVRLMDDAGNEITENYYRAYDSSPLKVEVVNALYLGNTDKTVASVSNLAIAEGVELGRKTRTDSDWYFKRGFSRSEYTLGSQ